MLRTLFDLYQRSPRNKDLHNRGFTFHNARASTPLRTTRQKGRKQKGGDDMKPIPNKEYLNNI